MLIQPLLEVTVVVDVVFSDKSSDLFLELNTMACGWPGVQTVYGIPFTLQRGRMARIVILYIPSIIMQHIQCCHLV